MRTWLPAFAVLLLLPAVARAQYPPPAVTYDETLSPRRSVEGLTAAEDRELMAAVDRVADLLRNIPGVREGVPGRCVRLYSEVPLSMHPRPVGYASLAVALRSVIVGRCPEEWNAMFWVYLNRIVQPGSVFFKDEQGPVYFLHPRTPDGGPHLDFTFNNERHIVMTRSGKPVFTPVPRERLLRHEAAELRNRLATAGNSNPASEASIRRDLDKVETALRTWPAATLAAPACLALETRAVLEPTADCARVTPLVTYAPLAFDPTLSRGKVQVITITTRHSERRPLGSSPAERDAISRIWKGLDLAALEALLR